jgi:chromosome segregation ATPase
MDLPHSATIEELREQLHQANARYHDLRQEWEKWLDASEYRHEERIDAARLQLQEAEDAIEAIEARILQTMDGQPK